ncbi:hypothetical protein VC83_04833 [Pseudogymnoascus destructans]|uniref:C2H2-type domain-containing protein n=2 Tax=Pseudogymnoascus destructans TaxID=655981 RepID=L8FRS7_PSED2|nr:uncharacterized protein VC83_04833 [Pseudogymnoascus destructans]ELR03163.1 hypothetical protein GMDG_05989 [Pseudogymnoascus destructans 20631-21]OAF57451.1 hypothetical protein VC83_04833 [Pseudogymnoascus destructans]
MTMAIDHQQRQFGALNFDHMPYNHSPHFTNPWSASSAPPHHSLYSSSHDLNPISLDSIPKEPPARLGSHASSMPPYASAPHTSASAGSAPMGTVYGHQQMHSLPQDVMSQNRVQPPNPAYGSSVSYSSGGSSHPTYATSTPYDSMGYTAAPVRSTYALQQQAQADNSRRLSQPSVASSSLLTTATENERRRQSSLIDFNSRSVSSETTRDFGDAINASRGMIAMSQNTTPRNIYGPNARNGRGSGDAYGFPATHSTNSSISSSGTYPAYFGGSVDSSLSDYSNTGSDIEAASSRTLPRPPGFMGGGAPPAPSSMMGQFSSKVSSSTQKKHKCKVCDKRFTRPSSLQTHMYSHTGEKPFACEVEGCGRHFSVVSNLRRHRKVHKGGAPSEAGSDDHHSE